MRKARQVIAGIVLLTSTLYICNIAGFLPQWLSPKFLIDLQLVPAILSASVASLIAIAALTFLLGRIYCSVLCPLGITQDLIIRLSQWIKRKRKIKRSKIYYKAPRNILRYGILALSIITLLLGSSYLILLLDPYSIFGRISTLIISPFTTLINNIIAHFTNAANNYTLVTKDFRWTSLAVIISTVTTFGIIIYLNIKHSRLWCNTICPVGTLLGLFSRFSLFKIEIDNNTCVDCKACAKVCKSHTIDNLNSYTVDHSRCISCYNCIEACKFDALHLSPSIKRKK